MGGAERRALVAGAAAAGVGLGWLAERRLADPQRRGPARPPQPPQPAARELSLVTDGGARLHVEVHGPDDDVPTIVLAHGWMMQLDFWRVQLAGLADRWRLVVYDHRGHGRSQLPPGGDCSPEGLAADLDAVLSATVPEGQRCVFVGHSMGGMALLALAAHDPVRVRERIAGTVLCSTAANELYQRNATCANSATVAVLQRALVPPVLGARRGGVGDNDLNYYAVRELALTSHADPGLVALVHGLVAECQPFTRAAFARMLGSMDLSEAIPMVPGPVLVIVGARDRLTPPRQSAVLAAGRADADLVVLPEVGHMAPLEAPEVVNARIGDFAAAVLRPAETGDAAPRRATAEG